MSATNDPVSTSLPWLTMWFRPRRAIDRLIAENRHFVVLALAAGATSTQTVAQLIQFAPTEMLRDWRFIPGAMLLGAVGGLLGLYLGALILGWIARLFRGRAPRSNVRAALAWGGGPVAIGLPIGLIGMVLAWFTGLVSVSVLVVMLDVLSTILGIWALILTVAMFARVERFGVLSALACFFVALFSPVVIALIVRSFLFQPFSIPAGSMKPTLLVGDYIFVSKYAYGYSRYSLPFSQPIFTGRKFASDPERGDVVVFRLPKDNSVDYVKRVVGLPGDRIQMIDGALHINAKAVQRDRIEDFVEVEDGRTNRVRRWRETLPNGVSYETLDLIDNGFLDNTAVYEVPAGHIFVLGDNRDNSTDSRVLSAMGYVPFDNLVGRAGVIFYSVDKSSGKSGVVRDERMGTIVR